MESNSSLEFGLLGTYRLQLKSYCENLRLYHKMGILILYVSFIYIFIHSLICLFVQQTQSNICYILLYWKSHNITKQSMGSLPDVHRGRYHGMDFRPKKSFISSQLASRQEDMLKSVSLSLSLGQVLQT